MIEDSQDTRPIKFRSAARVLVVSDGEVLLINDTDPFLPGTSWHTLPGGGIEPGEQPHQAAARELAEEVGLEVDELVGPIGQRRVIYGFSNRILIQDEVFFRVDTQKFEPDQRGLTEAERSRHLACGWFEVSELARMETRPGNLETLLRATADCPIDLGQVEESTRFVCADLVQCLPPRQQVLHRSQTVPGLTDKAQPHGQQ